MTTAAANPINIDLTLHYESQDWKKFPFQLKSLTLKVTRQVLSALTPNLIQSELCVILSDDAHLQTLNRTYRHQDKPTNILSFGYGEQARSQGLLGDLFLSYECLCREADQDHKTYRNHYIHLIIHGILHLLGYDHEQVEDAEKMEELERKFLQHWNIADPYQISDKLLNSEA